jgi:hypothetical protein
MQQLVIAVKKDWATGPVRFICENVAASLNICCAIVMALMSPNPPMLQLYAVFVFTSILFAIASYMRGAPNLVAMFGMYTMIDTIGLVRSIQG